MSGQHTKDRVSLRGSQMRLPQEDFTKLLSAKHRYELAHLRAEVNTLQEENARLREEMQLHKESSIKDHLTNVFNRRFLDIAVQKIITTEMRERRSWGIIITDIDRFKKINDDHGHQAADEVLKNVSQMMQHVSRSGDFVVRYGGDEFLIIVLNVTHEELVMIAERYRKSISAVTTIASDHTITITVSIGACFVPVDSSMQLGQVIGYADQALYRAKDGGRNCVQVFSDRRKESTSQIRERVYDRRVVEKK
jgi:diguanylate cyclase